VYTSHKTVLFTRTGTLYNSLQSLAYTSPYTIIMHNAGKFNDADRWRSQKLAKGEQGA